MPLAQGQMIQVDQYTVAGANTWTRPVWARRVVVTLLGAAGGAGSGRKGAAGSARSGGTGGSGPRVSTKEFKASDLTATVVVTIGAKGTGGAAVTASDTSGNDGTTGGDTTFGAFLTSRGGLRGRGGGAAITQGIVTGDSLLGCLNALATSVTVELLPKGSSSLQEVGGAGGSAASLTTGNAEVLGQDGGIPYGDPAMVVPARGAVGSNGANGANSAVVGIAGSSGAGGGAPGGRGGDGGRGAGGGGGGPGLNATTDSGRGGDGGDGYAVVTSYAF